MTQTLIESPDQTILDRFRTEIQRRGITQAAAAKEAGLSAAALTQLLNGSYNANPASQLEKIERWLGMQAEQASHPEMPAAPSWAPTPTAERVLAALSYAQMASDVAVIYGGAGLGKTTACREYRRRISSVWIVTMTPATASVATCLEEICYALGLKSPPQGAAKMQREIIRRIADTNGLLVIDEAQHLSVQALDALRSLHDATGVGLALVGNEAVYTSMTGGNRAAYLDRLFSRIGKRVKLTRPTKNDVLRLSAAMGISADDNDSLRMLFEIASRAGALRSVVKTVRLATMMAGGASPALKHLQAAWKDLSL
ncbi:MAG: AAA family ATPase [Candidatus Sericytochromatia bacterium]|nr:AAA family ATPase [Candidatus Sericytochromatia bacterium]